MSRPLLLAAFVLLLMCVGAAPKAPDSCGARDPSDRDATLLPRSARPVSDETLAAESQRLRETIDFHAQRLARQSGGRKTTGSAASHDPVVASDRPAIAMTRAERLAHNAKLRQELDTLLLKIAGTEERIPARGKSSGAFNPRIVDFTRANTNFDGWSVRRIEAELLFAGEPIAQTDKGVVVYEWAWSGSNPQRSVTQTQVLWARVKDGRAQTAMCELKFPVNKAPPPERPPLHTIAKR